MPLPDITPLGKNPTEAEKWVYYSEVYAWRIVRSWGKEEDRTCPIDPKGQWYNQAMVEAVASRYRRILEADRIAYQQAESQNPEIQAQHERYARGLAARQGRLDHYDAIHHPDALAKRGEAIAKTQHASEAVSKALDDLGITSTQAAE